MATFIMTHSAPARLRARNARWVERLPVARRFLPRAAMSSRSQRVGRRSPRPSPKSIPGIDPPAPLSRRGASAAVNVPNALQVGVIGLVASALYAPNQSARAGARIDQESEP